MELSIIPNDDEWSTDSGLPSSSSIKSSTNDDYDSAGYETAESGDDVESVYHSARSDSGSIDKSPNRNSSLSEALQRTARRMSEEGFHLEDGPPAPASLLRQWLIEGIVGGEQILKYMPENSLVGQQLKVAAQFFHVMNASKGKTNHIRNYKHLLVTHRSNSCPDLMVTTLQNVPNVWPIQKTMRQTSHPENKTYLSNDIW